MEGNNMTPRNKIIREIIQTETAYLKSLDEIVDGYKKPMEQSKVDLVDSCLC